MARILFYVACCALLLFQCHCQFYTPYERLPIASFQSFGGNFSFPAGGTESYDERTPMTIRWTTDFSAVNLYVVYNASVFPPSPGLQRQLSTGYSDSTFEWTVSCSPDCQAPFAIKAVNAYGDAEALYNEGFWSRQFWIRPTGTSSSVQSSSTSSAPSSSTRSSSTSSTKVTRTTAPPEMPSTTPSEISLSPTPSPDPNPSINTSAIGAGVGAGVGVALLCAGAFYLCRRRKAKATQRQYQGATISYNGYETYSSPQRGPNHIGNHSRPTSRPPGYKDIYEAPGWQVEPQELPGRSP